MFDSYLHCRLSTNSCQLSANPHTVAFLAEERDIQTKRERERKKGEKVMDGTGQIKWKRTDNYHLVNSHATGSRSLNTLYTVQLGCISTKVDWYRQLLSVWLEKKMCLVGGLIGL